MYFPLMLNPIHLRGIALIVARFKVHQLLLILKHSQTSDKYF